MIPGKANKKTMIPKAVNRRAAESLTSMDSSSSALIKASPTTEIGHESNPSTLVRVSNRKRKIPASLEDFDTSIKRSHNTQ